MLVMGEKVAKILAQPEKNVPERKTAKPVPYTTLNCLGLPCNLVHTASKTLSDIMLK